MQRRTNQQRWRRVKRHSVPDRFITAREIMHRAGIDVIQFNQLLAKGISGGGLPPPPPPFRWNGQMIWYRGSTDELIRKAQEAFRPTSRGGQ